MYIPKQSRTSEVTRHAGFPPTSPCRPRAFRRAWRALVAWSVQVPLGQGPTGSSDGQPQPGGRVRGMSTAAVPGGGATTGGTSVAPPPIRAPLEPAPASITQLPQPNQRRVDARHCARLPALIATLSSPDREIVLLRVVAGVSVPGIAATLGVTPAAIRLAQDQALSALQPAATANGPPPATRGRVVLLPHAQTEPSNTRRTGRANGMNQNGSPRHRPTQSGGDTARGIAASTQLNDAELAMKVARHSFEKWLVADHQDTPSPALMHACHTHEALHEAARATAVLIETFRAEAAALIATPAQGISPQCR
jgi:hypothetical protein